MAPSSHDLTEVPFFTGWSKICQINRCHFPSANYQSPFLQLQQRPPLILHCELQLRKENSKLLPKDMPLQILSKLGHPQSRAVTWARQRHMPARFRSLKFCRLSYQVQLSNASQPSRCPFP